MGFFKKIKKERVCVFGLDGVPHSLLLDLARQDVMPFFRTLIESGTLHKMKASLPEISSVSWTDFMTGTNSGSHGIFGFTDCKENSYSMRFPNFLDVKTETIWDRLGKADKKNVVINQPSTYPARRMNGTLISGFVAIELSKAVHPITIKPALEKIGYEIDIDTYKSREDHEFLWKELDRTLAGRAKAFDLLWQEEWDYFELVITGTDRLQHFLWDAYADLDHPYHQRFLDYYRQIDINLKKMAGAYEKLTGGYDGLFLLSDHGFTGIEQEVYLNAWLQKEGYLSYLTDEPKNMDDISTDSRAFAMDPSRIYFHYQDRYPRGSVNPSERDALAAEIKAKLAPLTHNGTKVVHEVFDTRDIYSGPYVEKGPDLIVLSEHGYDMKGSVKKKEIFGRSNLQGMHTWDDAFFWSLDEHGPDLAISQLSNIILDRFGLK
ncbi:MAG: alkaline phosphatase family protein [Acidobacteria bacterium]|nr:alkaline phosphatase family protein [Acidobacteriota bacterium]